MPLTLKQLTWFVALVEEKSFGRAAVRVHVSQPALSQQIGQLEAALGVVLVERRPRQAVPTRAGREVLRRARQVLAEVHDLESAARGEAGLPAPLHLGLIPTVAPYLLPGALAALRASDLRLDIRVREARTATLVEGLNDGALDAIVVALPVEGAGLAATPLFDDRFLLAGSAAALARAPAPLRPDALDADQLLLLDEGHCLADQALEVCGLDRRHARIDLGASSLATLCGLAAQGFGLTFLPEIAVATETAAAPGLILARFPDPQPMRHIGIVSRRKTVAQPWLADLAQLLREAGQAVLTAALRPPPS